ncbi:MAG TPA: nucleotide exchange factor GrpE [Gemmatimonadetes bacterium]|jgi:molecular chaperone GrpE|nr:nucleotide exchange factor GrpE [Gemmatimonadota bacterium]|tara:strand:- start:2162 stop:2755 length:594 start_codon:yes stop_codon:yes gene_type:complete
MTDAQVEKGQVGREQPAEESQNVTPDIPESDDDVNDTEPHVDAAESTELVALREEFDSLNDRHLRLVAEFNNFRRRSEQERRNVWSKAQADLVEKFLDVLDDLQRIAELDLSNATVDTIMEGVDLVERKFARTLEESGIEVIDPVGDEFDPERMEAMMRVPSDSQQQVGTVAQVLQKGYSLKDVLVRPARVSVFTQG